MDDDLAGGIEGMTRAKVTQVRSCALSLSLAKVVCCCAFQPVRSVALHKVDVCGRCCGHSDPV